MSGMGGGSGGGGGSGNGGVGDGVAHELAEVKAKIDKLEKAIDVQQQKLEAEKDDAMRLQIATALAADKQRLVELQKKENRLAEQQREQQAAQGGKYIPSAHRAGQARCTSTAFARVHVS